MTHDEVQDWLDRYLAAWRSDDPAAIAGLFAADATYRFHPWDEEPITGPDAIVAELNDRDEHGSWEAWYKPYSVEDDRAAVIGESRYSNPDGSLKALYYNAWALRFDGDGRCVDFVEYFMELPERLRAGR